MLVKTSPPTTEVLKVLFGKWKSLGAMGKGGPGEVSHVHTVLWPPH